MKEVNIVVGRFQPFTDGHLKCAECGFKQNGLKTAFLVIDGKEDERHPFGKELLKEMFNSLKRNPLIEDFIFVKNAAIDKNTEILREFGYEPMGWICGTDRFECYERMASNYGAEINLNPLFRVFCVDRGDYDISATKVREWLKMGNKEEFYNNVPSEIHPFFEKLSANLNKKTTE